MSKAASLIVATKLPLATSRTLTTASAASETYARVPSGEYRTSHGADPAGMAWERVSVAREMTAREPSFSKQ